MEPIRRHGDGKNKIIMNCFCVSPEILYIPFTCKSFESEFKTGDENNWWRGEIKKKKKRIYIYIFFFFVSSHLLLLHDRIRASWQGFPRRLSNCWLTLRTRLRPPGGERRLLTELLAITDNIHSSPPWGSYSTAEQFSNRVQCTMEDTM